MTSIHLGAVIRRTVRYEQNLCATLSQRFSYTEFTPNIFTDGNPNSNTSEINRSWHWASLKYALLVELAIIGQINLEPFSDHLSGIQNCDGVVKSAFTIEWCSDDDTWPAIGRVTCKFTYGFSQASRKDGFRTRSSGG